MKKATPENKKRLVGPAGTAANLRRLAEERLAHELQAHQIGRYKALLSAIPDIIMEVDSNKVYTWANRTGLEFFGEDVIGKEAASYFIGEQDTYGVVKPLFNGHEDVFYVESWQRRKDGEKRLLAWWCRVLKDERGRVTGALSTAHDITERQDFERRLSDSEAYYRTLVETSPDAIIIVEISGHIAYASGRAYEMFGLPPGQSAAGQAMSTWIAPEDQEKLKNRLVGILSGRESPGTSEYRLLTSDGRPFWGEISASLLPGVPGRDDKLLIICRDITERKASEEHTRELLREKETLLREIHHRVKNNMQIISSLLSLQADRLKDPEVKTVLKENQRRIRSMALVHEKLYGSKDLGKIDFADYIQGLTSHLFTSLQDDPDRIRRELRLEPLFLDISTAIPCGMIVSELVSNCLKHAFPQQKGGEIAIEFRRVNKGGDKLELVVRDDGVGFPAGVDFRKTETLGMEIVCMLTGQLDGSIELEPGKGTTFRILFEELHYKPRT